MANPSTTMSKFGTSYDINALNNLALKAGVKPLTPQQVKAMSPKELQTYLNATGKQISQLVKAVKKTSRTFRRNAKLTTSENYKQAQLMHGTIRQAIGEAGTLGAQAIATAAYSRKSDPLSAISQNTEGGTVPDQGGGGANTEKGPVYAYRGRRED